MPFRLHSTAPQYSLPESVLSQHFYYTVFFGANVRIDPLTFHFAVHFALAVNTVIGQRLSIELGVANGHSIGSAVVDRSTGAIVPVEIPGVVSDFRSLL